MALLGILQPRHRPALQTKFKIHAVSAQQAGTLPSKPQSPVVPAVQQLKEQPHCFLRQSSTTLHIVQMPNLLRAQPNKLGGPCSAPKPFDGSSAVVLLVEVVHIPVLGHLPLGPESARCVRGHPHHDEHGRPGKPAESLQSHHHRIVLSIGSCPPLISHADQLDGRCALMISPPSTSEVPPTVGGLSTRRKSC